jgi:hypothetical protein
VEAHTPGRPGYGPAATRGPSVARRLTTETKQAFKTTEFWVYVALLIGLFIAGAVSDGNTAATGAETAAPVDEGSLSPEETWLFAVILTVGYLISRGLAKAGSRDPYWDQPQSGDGAGIGDRVKAAAEALSGSPDETRETPPSEGRTASPGPGARY